MNLNFTQLSSFDSSVGSLALPNLISIRNEEPQKQSTPKTIQKKRAPSPISNDRHGSKHVKLHHGEEPQLQSDGLEMEPTTAQRRSNERTVDVENSGELRKSRSEKNTTQSIAPAINAEADALCKKVSDMSAWVKTFSIESTRELEASKSELRQHQANIMSDLLEVIDAHEPAMVFKLQQMKSKYL